MSGKLSTFATLHLSDVQHEAVHHSRTGAHRLVSFTAFERYDHIGCEGACTSGAATPTTGCEAFGHSHSFKFLPLQSAPSTGLWLTES